MDNKEYHETVTKVRTAIFESDLGKNHEIIKLFNAIASFGTTAYERGYKAGMKYKNRNATLP